MKRILITCFIVFSFALYGNAAFLFNNGSNVTVVIPKNEEQVVYTAFAIFQQDYTRVFGGEIKTHTQKGEIWISTLGLKSGAEKLVPSEDIKELSNHQEAFLIVEKKGKLIVLGSDKRGTAYGILELSRMIGVSPWEWWADSPIEKKQSLVIKDDFRTLKYPSVARRGIFINDEDWGLTPWSYLTYEPSNIKGQIGPKTHASIFELLLRLRANTFWPAMHDCSVAFYLTPGNKEIADKYGIYVGTSHCEPMVRNTNAEWKHAGIGEYNYLTNRDNILKFWEERVKLLSGSDNIYTLGIRGVHDGPMQGAKTLQEQKEALTKIFKDQRDMITSHVNPDVEKVSQVFIPYKEVLDVYKMGLEVPQDVTLMWTDDNYGYIKHFPDSIERARKGGNGIYYHVSYWGRPHDYLWLASTHPAHVFYQMKLAFDKGVKDIWILNVGDIKPAEYLIELFMDMAWNINHIEDNKQGLNNHLYQWLNREFGKEYAVRLLHVMKEYYRLAYIRKPEFMGNTRTEEKDPKYKIVTDLPWSESYIKNRIREYEAISDSVIAISLKIPENKKHSWFQLIEYPVRGATEMNKKHLYAQLARHGLADWKQSDMAYNKIESLTEIYNTLNNGKWNRIMDFKPRRLAVFDKVSQIVADKPLAKEQKPLFLFNGNEYANFTGNKPQELGLGHQGAAISLDKNNSITYNFEIKDRDSITIELALMPNHPVEGNKIRISIAINDGPPQIVNYRTEGRSEEWKQNVLQNQAITITQHALPVNGKAMLKITAMDMGVVIDQVKIWEKNIVKNR